MKNKHPNAIAVLALGLTMAGLHLADLLLWSDADTGFATAGSVWLRYILWLAALALPYLPARRSRRQRCACLPENRHGTPPLSLQILPLVCPAFTPGAVVIAGISKNIQIF